MPPRKGKGYGVKKAPTPRPQIKPKGGDGTKKAMAPRPPRPPKKGKKIMAGKKTRKC